MKRIHFENLSWNWFRIILLIVALFSILIGYGLILDYENNLLVIFSFLINIVILGKRFWYKYYVEYNKLGIIIKLNVITDKPIKFKEIDKIIIDTSELKLSISNKNDLKFNLNNIQKSDINKLLQILLKHSKPKFIDNRIHLDTNDTRIYTQ